MFPLPPHSVCPLFSSFCYLLILFHNTLFPKNAFLPVRFTGATILSLSPILPFFRYAYLPLLGTSPFSWLWRRYSFLSFFIASSPIFFFCETSFLHLPALFFFEHQFFVRPALLVPWPTSSPSFFPSLLS